MKKKLSKILNDKRAVTAIFVALLIILFAVVFAVTTTIYKKTHEKDTDTTDSETVSLTEINSESKVYSVTEKTTESTTAASTTEQAAVTTAATTKQNNTSSAFSPTIISFPSSDSAWKLICLNTKYRVSSDASDNFSLTTVAGSSERMDKRAAVYYEKMYSAAAEDGIYLTPCSGYRSYSTQDRLYNEFVQDYQNEGYDYNTAQVMASKRRMPPGSSEHNIGICMDIITASSSAGFQNTSAYAWLEKNAADYGFILRYPSDKVDVTGVKYEPWHWRYVGVENAAAIKASGLCLEEYLGK